MSAGLVDVDLVVGDDGWPRDVRRIRPVVARGTTGMRYDGGDGGP